MQCATCTTQLSSSIVPTTGFCHRQSCTGAACRLHHVSRVGSSCCSTGAHVASSAMLTAPPHRQVQLQQQQKPKQLRQRHWRQAPCALFTGIVQGKATVRSVRRQGDFVTLALAFPPGSADGIQIGASVAINGTCLTVTSIGQSKDPTRPLLSFDVISETLRATNLGDLEMNSAVNFERSARMGDEIGGHHVSGHVHTTAVLSAVNQTDPNNLKLTFQVPHKWMKYLLPKGFVAVDGCSLTVGEVNQGSFSVYLIPETLRVTVLGKRQVGDAVNIEIDAQTQAIVDTVETLLPRYLGKQPLGASNGGLLEPLQTAYDAMAGTLASGQR